ncbi:hypothetical protein WDV85_10420 [Pseudokineococcus sp. 5B2Z-1]|uniref:hypothetical protein n=1 Tax=Pseudokineococcus sp. 5B2Z-1 TaxID=3132744 RepID=UPI00309E8083
MSRPVLGLRVAAVAAAALTALPAGLVAGLGPLPAAAATAVCALAAVVPRSAAAVVGPALLVVSLALAAVRTTPGVAVAVLVPGTATLWCTHVLLTTLAAAAGPGTIGPGLAGSVLRRLWPPLLAAAPVAAVCAVLEVLARRGGGGAGWTAAVGLLLVTAAVVLATAAGRDEQGPRWLRARGSRRG